MLLSYADDIASVGHYAAHNAEYLAFLVDEWPSYGYFLSLPKSYYICTGKDERVANATFSAR